MPPALTFGDPYFRLNLPPTSQASKDLTPTEAELMPSQIAPSELEPYYSYGQAQATGGSLSRNWNLMPSMTGDYTATPAISGGPTAPQMMPSGSTQATPGIDMLGTGMKALTGMGMEQGLKALTPTSSTLENEPYPSDFRGSIYEEGAISPTTGELMSMGVNVGADILGQATKSPAIGAMGKMTSPAISLLAGLPSELVKGMAFSGGINTALSGQMESGKKLTGIGGYATSLLNVIPVLGPVLSGMLGGLFGKEQKVGVSFYYPGIGNVPTDVDPALAGDPGMMAANQHQLLKQAYMAKLNQEAQQLVDYDWNNFLSEYQNLPAYQSVSLPELGMSTTTADQYKAKMDEVYNQVYAKYGGSDISAIMSPEDRAIYEATSPEVYEAKMRAINPDTYFGSGLWAGEFA